MHTKSVQPLISKLTNDKSPPVRFQARLTALIAGADQIASDQLYATDAQDRWMRASILFSIRPGSAGSLLNRYAPDEHRQEPYAEGELALIEAFSELDSLSEFHTGLSVRLQDMKLTGVRRPEASLAVLRGVAKAAVRKALPDDLRSFIPFDKLVQFAQDPSASMANRVSAISLLALDAQARNALLGFAAKQQEQPIRLTAISALARQSQTDHWQALLQDFSSDTPPIRRAIIDGLLSSSDKTRLLLNAIESGQIKPSEIDLAQVKRLTTYRDAKIKARAEKLLAAATPADRAKALEDYQPVLAMKGDPQHGQAIFEKNCAACHRIAGIGTTVAPDISDSRTKKYEQLLADIVQPNRAIDNNYLGYTVRLADGSVLTGILTAETATSITLRQQGGKDAVLPRTEIEELKSTGQSLMPEGLERNIPPQEMADLLAFIKNWRYLDGRTPLAQ